MSLFRDRSSGRYSHATTNMIKKNVYILKHYQNIQSRQIQDKFAVIIVTRVELGDHRKLLHILDLTLV